MSSLNRALSIALAWIVASSSPAWAWGRIGHRAAAKVAEDRLTPEARAAVRALLEPGETLADASTWADEHRRDMPESGAWHYVNVPITEAHYDAKFCPPEGCVVSKIKEFRLVVADTARPRAERQKALRFLVHFIEDMHQPVHVGDRGDRGGNDLQLRFFDEGTNLHRLWDSGLVERVSTDEAAWVRDLAAAITPEQAESWAKGTVEDWADESLAAAKLAYQPPGFAAPLKPGTKLGEAYAEFATPIARRRLAQSAVRMAAVLNDALGRD